MKDELIKLSDRVVQFFHDNPHLFNTEDGLAFADEHHRLIVKFRKQKLEIHHIIWFEEAFDLFVAKNIVKESN